jgi:DNA polymerase III delta prime subunit
MQERILALSMRPKSFNDLVGQDQNINLLIQQKNSKRMPHFYILSGPIGSGKTTLARILALTIQADSFDITQDHWNNYKKYDILEVNAANDTSVDFTRKLIENNKYKPSAFSRAKVVIMDEAHQLSNAAQNALLAETEDTSEHVYYIFCTSIPAKIIIALKRRAFILSPQLLTNQGISKLVDQSAEKVSFTDTNKLNVFKKLLVENDVTSSGLVLQAVERLFSGLDPGNSVLPGISATGIDTLKVCREVSNGNWNLVKNTLEKVVVSELYGIKLCILGYLKTILIKTSGTRSLELSRGIRELDSTSTDNVTVFLAGICIVCNELESLPSKKRHSP